MANERRLIDGAELISMLPIVEEDKQISLIGAVADVVSMISKCQSVDAVEVVRCKDCKWFASNNNGEWYGCPMFNAIRVVPEDAPSTDDFCSCGERREEDVW